MAAAGLIKIVAQLTGLGEVQDFAQRFTLTNTPALATYNYRELAVADTAEALDLGGVSTVDLIIFKAVDNDMLIDTSYVSSFVEEINVPAGEIAIFKPGATVYVKNEDAAETPAYEYLVIGR